MSRQSKQVLAILTSIFIVIFISRLVRLPTLEMDRDEIWSIWQTFGTPAQVLQWTPPDWTPGWFLLVSMWQHLVGISPLIVRLLVVFIFLITSALLYRVPRDIATESAAIIEVMACAVINYVVVFSVTML